MTAPALKQQAKAERFAITSPESGKEIAEKTHIVAFVMPSKSTLEALPMPNNDDVKLRVIPKKKFTTLAFSGSMLGEKSVAMKK